MRLLDLLYNDAYISNLLLYGVEGVHYAKTGTHSVLRYPDSQYSGINGYSYCNQYIAYMFDGAPETLWREMIEADATAPRSKAYGFEFNPQPVIVQIRQCDAVYEQYTDMLFSGLIDPQSLRQEVIEAYRQAGIEEIVAEKQHQLDLFLGEGTLEE